MAKLVRAGEDGALDALIGWTANRTLESECLLGLGVIHAFELGNSCGEETARRAVSKPSLASDWMLRTLYGTRERSARFRYAVSPQTPARLDDNSLALFDRFNTMAAPPAILHTLEWLEDALDFAFVDRWRHDWTWICRSHGAQAPEPDFFLGQGRGRSGSLHMPQSEMLVSAYLRTLAYATHIGKMPAGQAEFHAMLALPMNRGLAALEPVGCPAWSRNLLQRWRDSRRELIDGLWAQAGRGARPSEIPAAMQLVEADEKDFIQVEVDLVVGHGTFDAGEPVAKSPKYVWNDAETGCMAGDIRLREGQMEPLRGPMKWACLVAPYHVGRVDAAVALRVKLACLGLGRSRGTVRCGANDVELQVDNDMVSRWHHWYTQWEPSKFARLESDVSGMTTVRRSWLQGYVKLSGLSVALLTRSASVHGSTRTRTTPSRSTSSGPIWGSARTCGVRIPIYVDRVSNRNSHPTTTRCTGSRS